MKLARLRLRNFRCYKEEISIDFEDITAFVGKNDSGKSTLMDALEIFLNDGTPDKDDASRGGDAKDLTVICEFADLPDSVIIDEASPTSLADEYLLNPGGRLEIHKQYSGDLKNPKCKSVEVHADHPTAAGVADLLRLKNADLKKRAEELGVDLEGVDQKVNAQVRARIREHIGELGVEATMVSLNDDNAAKVWMGLKKYLPAFALFKSDRASTDQDAEAQDPLKAAVKEAIKAKEEELNRIADHVKEEVQKIATATLDKLREMDPTLASELTPTFAAPKWESLFRASITSDEDIPINKRGSGVKRLILLNFFRAKAEQAAREKDRSAVIYGIEEPETSQHPNNQRMLLRALSDLSADSQVIVTTHTPMLARGLPDNCLRYVEVGADGAREVKNGGPDTNALFARALGVLPDSTVKLFIGVEGPTDIVFLQTMASSLRAAGADVPDLVKLELDGEMIFFPLGGSTLALWTSRLENLNRPEFHLYSRDTDPPDPPKYQEFVDEVNARESCTAKVTGKREIENYLHKDAIIAAYAGNRIVIEIAENFGPTDDVPLEVAKLVHGASGSPTPWDDLDEEKRGKKESKVKRMLCSVATKHMTAEMLGEIDPDGDVLSWFAEMGEMLK